MYIYYYRIAVFSIEVLKDERIVIIAEQRPECPEEEVFIIIFLASRDYVPGELMLSPKRWRRCLSASALAQCLSFQMCA